MGHKNLLLLIVSLLICAGLYLKSYAGEFAPKNAAVIWLETKDGVYLSTLYLSTFNKNLAGDELLNYILHTDCLYNCELLDLRKNHKEPIEVTWDCIDYYGNPLIGGTYQLWVEFTEDTMHTMEDEYFGKTISTTFNLDINENMTDTVDDTTYFSDFFISYTAPMEFSVSVRTISYDNDEIIFFPQQHRKNQAFTFNYNPFSGNVSVTSGVFSNIPLFLRIMSLNGRTIFQVPFNSGSVNWNTKNHTGQGISTGTYIFGVYSAENNKIITSVPFSIVK